MRRMRHLLAAIPITAVLTVAGHTSTAGAFVTAQDQCGSYIYGYQYWGAQYVYEYDRWGFETPYAAYAYIRVQDYGNLIQYYHC
jgi:hypothetical protein